MRVIPRRTPSISRRGPRVLTDDPLFYLVAERQRAVTGAVKESDIRDALRRTGLSARLVADEAMRRLGPTFNGRVADEEQMLLAAATLLAPPPVRSGLRLAEVLVTIAVPAMVVGGGLWIWGRPPGWFWVAAIILTCSGLLSLAVTFVVRRIRQRQADELRGGSDELEDVRRRILVEVALPVVRETINSMRPRSFSRLFEPLTIEGLGDLLHPSYEVPTAGFVALQEAMGELRAGSIGISGTRGAGKSTLIRAVVEGRHAWGVDGPSVGVMIPAPVRYDAVDFVPYLFRQLCLNLTRESMGHTITLIRRPPFSRDRVRWLSLLMILVGVLAIVISSGSPAVVIAVAVALTVGLASAWRAAIRPSGPVEYSLAAEALEHLSRLRYVDTESSEWSGEFAGPIMKLASRAGLTRVERVRTLPEITADYTRFVRRVAQDRRVVIGIDELDKMATDDARRFLNDIKALFGQSNVYYLVSISDDAMGDFEQRGLPVRDVFDSVFDDVVRVPELHLEDATTLLSRRIIGVSQPFPALCHMLSGGLPRELIRCARQASAISARLATPDLSAIALQVVCAQIDGRQHAAEIAAARYVTSLGDQPVISWLRAMPRPGAAVDLLARCRLTGVLQDLANIEEPDPLRLLIAELAASWYHAATILEIFESLDEKAHETWFTSLEGRPSTVDLLAGAYRDLSVAPAVSWSTTGVAREQLGLPLLSYALKVGQLTGDLDA